MLQQPHSYAGEFGLRGHDDQCFEQKSYFVNGVINKTDSNFLHGFFVNDIAKQNLILGPYPIYEVDVDEIVSLKAKAVMNIQTAEEDKARHFNKVPIEKFYKSKGI